MASLIACLSLTLRCALWRQGPTSGGGRGRPRTDGGVADAALHHGHALRRPVLGLRHLHRPDDHGRDRGHAAAPGWGQHLPDPREMPVALDRAARDRKHDGSGRGCYRRAASAEGSDVITSTRSVNLRDSPDRSAPTPTTRRVTISPRSSWISTRTEYSQAASLPGWRILPSTLSGHTDARAGRAAPTASKRRCR